MHTQVAPAYLYAVLVRQIINTTIVDANCVCQQKVFCRQKSRQTKWFQKNTGWDVRQTACQGGHF